MTVSNFWDSLKGFYEFCAHRVKPFKDVTLGLTVETLEM
jgi:hypothetical protein